MCWDNGSGLNVVYGEDTVRKIPAVKTVCYGRTEEWYSRAEAERFSCGQWLAPRAANRADTQKYMQN